MSSLPVQLDLPPIHRGDTYVLPAIEIGEDGVLADVAGATALVQLRRYPDDETPLVTLTEADHLILQDADADLPTLDGVIPAELTAGLEPGEAYLECEIRWGNGQVTTYWRAKVQIVADVARRSGGDA